MTLIRTKLFMVTANLEGKDKRFVYDSLCKGSGLGLGCGVLKG